MNSNTSSIVIRRTGISAGLQFATFIILTILITVTLYIKTNGIAHATFWLLRGYLQVRFFFFTLLIFLVCVLAGIWAAREILVKGKSFIPIGALYGFLVLICGCMFLPLYLTVQCEFMHRFFLERFMIRTYFERIPTYIILGLIPMLGLGVWFGKRMSLGYR